MIILGICNYSLVFLVGAGTAGPPSIIIGFWGVRVGVGVWSAYNVCSSSTIVGEVSACIGCRRVERCLGHRFYIYVIFLLLRGFEYHVSTAVF